MDIYVNIEIQPVVCRPAAPPTHAAVAGTGWAACLRGLHCLGCEATAAGIGGSASLSRSTSGPTPLGALAMAEASAPCSDGVLSSSCCSRVGVLLAPAPGGHVDGASRRSSESMRRPPTTVVSLPGWQAARRQLSKTGWGAARMTDTATLSVMASCASPALPMQCSTASSAAACGAVNDASQVDTRDAVSVAARAVGRVMRAQGAMWLR